VTRRFGGEREPGVAATPRSAQRDTPVGPADIGVACDRHFDRNVSGSWSRRTLGYHDAPSYRRVALCVEVRANAFVVASLENSRRIPAAIVQSWNFNARTNDAPPARVVFAGGLASRSRTVKVRFAVD
jgi:hypothetical protein